jgi:hypothetical protein
MICEVVGYVLGLFCIVSMAFRRQVSALDNIRENLFIPLLQNICDPARLFNLTLNKYFFVESKICLVINAGARPDTCFWELSVI